VHRALSLGMNHLQTEDLLEVSEVMVIVEQVVAV
jgi:hypothetical protein